MEENFVKIDYLDLLGRKKIKLNNIDSQSFLKDKRILITGAAGSIGGHILKRLIEYGGYKEIICVDINESGLYNLLKDYKSKKIRVLVLDCTIRYSVEYLFKNSKIDYVFHAAAYKHVPLVEQQPFYGIYNNLISTKNLSDFSIEYNAKRFVLVSTDKAVNPTNLMGVSKRLCEIYTSIVSKNSNSRTKFITTRFGNVLGSNGSVIPIFIKQILNGGPIELTDEKIERYFMLMEEAADLVIEACRIGNNDQILIFDMGKPVLIKKLAERLILQILGESNNIEFKIIGLRPGEKMYEELFLENEELEPTVNDKIYIGKKISNNKHNSLLQEIIRLLNDRNEYPNLNKIRSLIKQIIPDYTEDKRILKDIAM